MIARHISLSAAIWSAARLRRNQPASLELRNRLNSLTPRKWAKIPWDFTYLCWANPYILFPARFRLVLKSHLHATPRNRYLFETRRFGPFTTRRFQKIVQGYREMAGIMPPLHPHLFRHQMLTFLTSKGLSDGQIQLISGHESKKSLEVYQHLSLESVDKAYQDAVQAVGV